ncbi:MAG: GNAT family N-acetyltransferase [Acidobacteria bacterium]|nr:GNAT family N-acetyltransferase [Acidobacteriota bacterium]
MSDALNQISFREMSRADVAAGLGLCRASRWNQLSRDWECFLKLSPRGCRVAVKDDRVIGTVATVSYQDRFSWIGMVLVDPAERRQGIGSQLMREALKVLGDQETIRLDATPDGREVYLKLDFVDEYRLSRMEAVVSGRVTRDEDNPARLMTKADLPRVFEMDHQVFGADRDTMLKWMFGGAPEYSWVIVRDGEIAGYTFGRHGFNFEHLGPVIARDCETARRLVAACLSNQLGRPFLLDASRHDAEWARWLESIGFKEQRPFIRMFCGKNRYPGLPEKQYAILGPEFG